MGETGKRFRPQQYIDNDDKQQKRRGNDKESFVEGELVVYRILCPDVVIGSVIGKSGKVINAVRQETRARIKILDPFPGAKERVVAIYSHEKAKKDWEIDDDNGEPLCPAQDALLKVHGAISSAMTHADDSDKKQKVEARMLVPGSQVANVIGKSGSTIKRLRTKTNANIKVTPKNPNDITQSYAMSFDNIVQIAGDSEAVKNALFAMSAIMYKFSPKEDIPLDSTLPDLPPTIIIPADGPIYPSAAIFHGADSIFQPPNSIPSIASADPVRELKNHVDGGSEWPIYSTPFPVDHGHVDPSRSEELVVRLLCPSKNLGRVIGKGGGHIKNVRKESGARVEVVNPKADSDYCVVTVTSVESMDDMKSCAVEAVLLLQEKINSGDEEEKVNISFLVPRKVLGCLIGKSGSVINDMRKRTKADIRISKGKKPDCANDDDELVEVFGEVATLRDALVQIVLKLRDDALKDKDGTRGALSSDSLIPGGHHTTATKDSLYSANSHSGLVPDSLYSGTIHRASDDPLYSTGLSVPSSLSSIPPITPLGYDRRDEMGSNMGRLSSSSLYGYGSYQAADGGYGGLSSYSSKPYGSLSTPLEIVIPSNAVGKVIGKGGANLENIRKISGAAVEIHDSKSSRAERVAHISGTPDQKRSAEHLIQAFILAT